MDLEQMDADLTQAKNLTQDAMRRAGAINDLLAISMQTLRDVIESTNGEAIAIAHEGLIEIEDRLRIMEAAKRPNNDNSQVKA